MWSTIYHKAFSTCCTMLLMCLVLVLYVVFKRIALCVPCSFSVVSVKSFLLGLVEKWQRTKDGISWKRPTTPYHWPWRRMDFVYKAILQLICRLEEGDLNSPTTTKDYPLGRVVVRITKISWTKNKKEFEWMFETKRNKSMSKCTQDEHAYFNVEVGC